MVRSGTKAWYKSAVVKRRRGYEADSEEFVLLMR